MRIVELRADQLPGVHAKPCCRRDNCRCETGYLVAFRKSSGRLCLRWCCDNCEDCFTARDLPYDLLGPKPNLNVLPHINRAERLPGEPEPCAVCDQPSAEWHHWAPQAIFPDWPDVGVDLCTGCHVEWHERMRAHGLRWPGELPQEDWNVAW